jgi:predicted TIM-barrel fold metal-dependent hydrolase
MQNFRNDENVFMKLSGAFNEFSTSSPTPSSIEEMVIALKPYLDVVFENFKGRVMFGSDWPVCNVGGPKGEQGNWTFWREVVEAVLQGRGLSDESGSIWWRAGARAYGVKL